MSTVSARRRARISEHDTGHVCERHWFREITEIDGLGPGELEHVRGTRYDAHRGVESLVDGFRVVRSLGALLKLLEGSAAEGVRA